MGTKDKLKELEEKITKGLEESYKKMVKFKRYKNSPIVISKDGEIVKIDPNLVELDK